MSKTTSLSPPGAAIPPDDHNRKLTVADPNGANMRHVFVAATLTTVISGEQTNGRYAIIDALVPAGSGPVPHRHNFEEAFIILDGELEFTFRGATQTVYAGSTINVPANAPHGFKNSSGKTVHVLFLCSPAGQEEFFMEVGVPVESRTSPPPKLTPEQQAKEHELAKRLAPKYQTEILKSEVDQD